METSFILKDSDSDRINISRGPIRIGYDVAISDDFFPKSNPYPRDEIISLINEKKIYPIDEVQEPIETFSEKGTAFHKIPTLIPDEIKVKKESFVKDAYIIEDSKDNRDYIHFLVASSMPPKELLSNIKYYIEDIMAYIRENERRITDKDKVLSLNIKQLYEKHFPTKNSRY